MTFHLGVIVDDETMPQTGGMTAGRYALNNGAMVLMPNRGPGLEAMRQLYKKSEVG